MRGADSLPPVRAARGGSPWPAVCRVQLQCGARHAPREKREPERLWEVPVPSLTPLFLSLSLSRARARARSLSLSLSLARARARLVVELGRATTSSTAYAHVATNRHYGLCRAIMPRPAIAVIENAPVLTSSVAHRRLMSVVAGLALAAIEMSTPGTQCGSMVNAKSPEESLRTREVLPAFFQYI